MMLFVSRAEFEELKQRYETLEDAYKRSIELHNINTALINKHLQTLHERTAPKPVTYTTSPDSNVIKLER